MTDLIYDGIIVLSYDITVDGKPTDDLKARIETGVELYKNGLSELLIMTGWHNPVNSDDMASQKTHAQVMAEYARRSLIEQGLKTPHIILEENARDTVGQAYFTIKNIAEPKNLEKLVVVTSGYHTARAFEIFKFVAGADHLIEVAGAYSPLNLPDNTREVERRRIQTFRDFFEGVQPGDLDTIKYKLLTEHPFYKGQEQLFA